MHPKIIITGDGSTSLFVAGIDETYHSTHGAIQESQHVFIEAGFNFICNKDRALSAVKIFEMGFGTGLNALLTATAARQLQQKVAYTAIELNPLPQQLISRLNYIELTAGPENLFETIHATRWNELISIEDNFRLKKIKASFITFKPDEQYNLIYFDAFSPAKQSELWDLPMLEKCYQMLKKNGVFVTYSAKGQLKRNLKAVGFVVETLPGPPGKLQMVRGTRVN